MMRKWREKRIFSLNLENVHPAKIPEYQLSLSSSHVRSFVHVCKDFLFSSIRHAMVGMVSYPQTGEGSPKMEKMGDTIRGSELNTHKKNLGGKCGRWTDGE